MKKIFIYILICSLLGCTSIEHQSREYFLNNYGQAYCTNHLQKSDESLKEFFTSLGLDLIEVEYKNQKLYAVGTELNLSRVKLVVDEINLDPEIEIEVEILSGPETIKFMTEEEQKKVAEEFGFEWADEKKN